MNEIADWREHHPKATLREIEEEIAQRLSGLRAKMLSDTANRSAQAERECPDCGAQTIKKGKKQRILLREENAAGCGGSGQAADQCGWGGETSSLARLSANVLLLRNSIPYPFPMCRFPIIISNFHI